MTGKNGWIFLIIINLVMTGIMLYTGSPLKTPATPHGIIDLEMAADASAAQNILNFWDNDISQQRDVLEAARINTYWDFLFLLCYSLLFYFACKRLLYHFNTPGVWSFLCKTGLVLSVMTGLLDILENTGMLISLRGNVSDQTAMLTASASMIKWILVGWMILFLLSGYAYMVIQRRRRRS
jgi:hypothetical protein